jgi:ferrochelatase
LASFLEKRLRVRVAVGLRHGEPSVEAAVEMLGREGFSCALAVHLCPLRSSRSDRPCLDRAREAGIGRGLSIAEAPPWHLHPALIRAFARRLEEALARARGRALTVFTAHSLPEECSGSYAEQFRRCARAVAREARAGEWDIAFQSPPIGARGRWLGPDPGEVAGRAAREGAGSIVVQPLGFLMECLETLFDLDAVLGARARELGLGFHRVPALGPEPPLVEALARVVEESPP